MPLANTFRTKTDAIAADLTERVKNGAYTAKLPSVFTLADEYGVNFKTVNKAFAELGKQGILCSEKGKGTFVASRGREVAEASSPVGDFAAKLVPVFMPTGQDLYGAMYEALVSSLNHQAFYPVMMDSMDRGAVLDVLNMKPGVIVIDHHRLQFPFEVLKEHAHEGFRLVFMQRYGAAIEFDADFVLSDSTYGGYLATKHLLDLGHRRIVFLSYGDSSPAMEHRYSYHYGQLQGYQLALSEQGDRREEIYYDTLKNKDEDMAGMRAMLSDPETRPTAILADSDSRLLGYYDLFREMGIRIPDDLAVVGFYNLAAGRHLDVPLTSVSIREDEIARLTAERVMDTKGPRRRIMVKPELIVRQSCGS